MVSIGPFLFNDPRWLPIGIIAVLLLAFLVLWRSRDVPWYRKLLMVLTRTLIVGALFVALAGPYVTDTTSSVQTSRLVVLYDNSSSMRPYQVDETQVFDAVRSKMAASVQTIAVGDSSPLVNRLLGSLVPFGQYLLISDGQATDGDSYAEVVAAAQSLNASIHVLAIENDFGDAGVLIEGPRKTLAGARNTYVVRVVGNNKLPGTLRVSVDGRSVLETDKLDEPHTIQQTFTSTATRKVEAHLDIDDTFDQNDRYYLTTAVLPKPKVLMVGANGRLESFLSEIFDVTRQSRVPTSLDGYSAVVSANADANSLSGSVLEDFVANGNGAALIGGANAFDFGGYDRSDAASLIPVKSGSPGDKRRAAIVIAVDISASTSSGFSSQSSQSVSDVEKSLAYEITRTLDGDNMLGVVAFNTEGYLVSDLTLLGQGRDLVLDKISRLQHSGGTRLNVGLRAAYELLKDMSGARSVIFISDGGTSGGDNDGQKTYDIAGKLGKEGIKLFTVGVGANTNEGIMRGMAKAGNGVYLQPGETDRISIDFGKTTGQEQRQQYFTLSVLDAAHPITAGLTNPSSTLNNVNRVVPKNGAQALVTTSQGDVAVTAWNYGLGRVAAWTAYTGVDDMGNYLSAPDSILMTRMLTWVAGDPERNNPPLLRIEDTVAGQPARVQAHGESLDDIATRLGTSVQELQDTLKLEEIDEQTFIGSLAVYETGFHDRFGAVFAVNAPEEYQSIGLSQALKKLPEYTKGKYIKANQLDELVEAVRQNTAQALVPVSYVWVFIVGALVVLIIEIFLRKLEERMRSG